MVGNRLQDNPKHAASQRVTMTTVMMTVTSTQRAHVRDGCSLQYSCQYLLFYQF